jgi:hypothetical protein
MDDQSPTLDDQSPTLDDDVILLDTPVIHDADDLVEAEYMAPGRDQDEIETEQVVLLDMVRLDDGDIDFA